MINKYDYEEDLDILYVYNNPNSEKVVSNLSFGNVVIDIGQNGKVLGVEVDCASKIFKLPIEQLKNLKVAKIEVIKIGNMITFGIVLSTAIKEYNFQFAVPQQTDRLPMVAY